MELQISQMMRLRIIKFNEIQIEKFIYFFNDQLNTFK